MCGKGGMYQVQQSGYTLESFCASPDCESLRNWGGADGLLLLLFSLQLYDSSASDSSQALVDNSAGRRGEVNVISVRKRVEFHWSALSIFSY